MATKTRSGEFAEAGLKWGAIIGTLAFIGLFIAFPPVLLVVGSTVATVSLPQLAATTVIMGIFGAISGAATGALTGGIIGALIKKDKECDNTQPLCQTDNRRSQPPMQNPQIERQQNTDISTSPASFRNRVDASRSGAPSGQYM